MSGAGLFSLAAVLTGIGIAGSLLAVLAIVGVGMAYNPDMAGGLLMIGAIAVAICVYAIGVLIKRPLGNAASLLTMAVGTIAGLAGIYGISRDPGDAVLYAGPVLVGAGLIILAFEPRGGT